MYNIIDITYDESSENDDDDYKNYPKSPKLINNKDIYLDHLSDEENELTCESQFLKFFTTTNINSQNSNSCPKNKENGTETVPEQSYNFLTPPQQLIPLPLTQVLSVSPKDFPSNLFVDENDVIIISDDDSSDVRGSVFCSDERVASDSATNFGEHFEISRFSSSEKSQFSMSGLPGWLSKASFSQTSSFDNEEEEDKISTSNAKTNAKNGGSSSELLTGQALEVHTKPKTISRSDSFDIVPTQASQDFPHCRHINKKDERQKLNGYTCRDCHDYWSSSYQSQEEMEKNVKSKSRHRELYRAPPSPEGYWKLGFHLSDEEKQVEGEDEASVSTSSGRHRRRRPLEKKFKSKSEEGTDTMLNTKNDSGCGSED